MRLLLWQPYQVRHRIDGLETCRDNAVTDKFVRHRIDGLEKEDWKRTQVRMVRHRIDGLEN